jgi:outer membrane protein W
MYEDGRVKIEKISSSPPKFVPHKREARYNLSLKAGVYFPTDDLEEADNGFYGEISFNHYITKYIALETGLGYFQVDYDESVSGLGSSTEDIYAIPIIANIKGVIPFEYGEFSLGAGLSGYYVNYDADVNLTGFGSSTVSDDDFIWGFQLLSSLNFNIAETFFLGLEGKYIFTEDAEIEGSIFGVPVSAEFNLNGFIATGVLGFRF